MGTNLESKIGWLGEWKMAPWHPELTAERSALASTIAAVTSGKTDSELYLGQWPICAIDLTIFRLIINACKIM